MQQPIVIDANEIITCPDCGHEFALSKGIASHTIERYESAYSEKLTADEEQRAIEMRKQVEKQAAKQYSSKLEALQEQLESSQAKQEKLQGQLEKAAKQAAEEARKETLGETLLLQETLKAKEEKLAHFQAQELTLRKDKQALLEDKREMELTLQRQLDAARDQIVAEQTEAFRLKEAEYQQKFANAQKVNDTLKRQLSQGSQQLQGEVLELELEQTLREAFPIDGIEEVKKGKRGADVIQNVMTMTGTKCGAIIWEAKRAENWSNGWIQKLKDDQVAIGAEIPVLVSTVLPDASKQAFVQHEGIWVVRPSAVKPMAEILRTILLESQKQRAANTGKNQKIEALYDYLCSPQFGQKLRSVVDSYEAMKYDLDKEKAAMHRLWKKRESQLERITVNVVSLCGEMQGLAHDALPQLDFIAPFPDDLEPEANDKESIDA